MDQWLAQIYGTGGAEDIEKTAQHHLLQKLAEEEGLDLSGLSEDDLNALASEVLGDEDQGQEEGQEEVQEVEAAPEEAPYEEAAQEVLIAKEAEAKFEEADFLGRVMAHAYTQELSKIAAAQEKTAGRFGAAVDTARGAVRGALSKVKSKAQSAGGHVKAHTSSGSSSKVRKGMDYVGKRRGRFAAGAGVAAGYGMGKEASAFNKLAEMQAMEMLNAAGIDPSAGQQEQAQPQQAAQQNPAQQQRPPFQQGQRPAQQQVAQRPAVQPQRPAQQPQQAQQPGQLGQGGQQQADPAQFAQSEQFQDMVNNRALEIISELGIDPEQVIQLLSQQQQGQGGQQGGQQLHR
jgi:hypothetical protein